MVVKELITKLGFNVDEKPVKKFEGGVNRLISLGKKLAATYLTLEAVKGLGRMVKSVADFGDQLDETSKKIGLSTDAIQKFGYAAKLSGVEQGTFNAGLKIFSRNIGEAKNGSKTALQSFKDLKLDPRRFKSNEEGFLAVAEAISKVPDPARQAALAMGVFGRSGAEFLPVFEGGSKEIERLAKRFEALGGLMGPKAIKDAREFNDAWDDIGVIFNGIKKSIGAAILPVVRDLAVSFTEWYIVNKDLIFQNVGDFLSGVASSLRDIWRGFKMIMPYVKAFLALTSPLVALYYLLTDIAGFFQGKQSVFGLILTRALGVDVSNWQKLKDEVLKQWEQLKQLARSLVVVFNIVWESIKAFFVRKWNEIVAAVKNLPNIARQAIELIKTAFTSMIDSVTNYLTEKFTSAFDSVKSIFDFSNIKLPSGIGQSIGGFFADKLSGLQSSLSGFSGMNGGLAYLRQAPALSTPAASKSVNSNSSLNYAPTINVNVQNADSKEIGEEVKRQTQDQLATLFRQTLRANQVGAV